MSNDKKDNDNIDKKLNYYFDNYPRILNSKYKIWIILLYLVHLVVTFWQPYIVITFFLGYKNFYYDKLIVLILVAIALHWIFLKNECIISYIEKKMINKNYEAGEFPSLHPGLFYFMNTYLSYNLYDYNKDNNKKVLSAINTYILPPMGVFYLMYRNDFFGNKDLCKLLIITHIVCMIYQFRNDKILNNFS